MHDKIRRLGRSDGHTVLYISCVFSRQYIKCVYHVCVCVCGGGGRSTVNSRWTAGQQVECSILYLGYDAYQRISRFTKCSFISLVRASPNRYILTVQTGLNIHSFIVSFIYWSIHWFIHTFTVSFTHWFIHCLIRDSLIDSFVIHLLIHSWFTHWYIYRWIDLFIDLFTHYYIVLCLPRSNISLIVTFLFFHLHCHCITFRGFFWHQSNS